MSQRNKQISPALIMDYIKKHGPPCTTLDIAKALGTSRKEINPTLYKMQDQGVIRKIRESPPLWSLTAEGSAHSIRPGVGRGRGRARRSPTPTSSSQPGYNFSFQDIPTFQFTPTVPNTGMAQPSSGPQSPTKSPPVARGRNELQRRLLEVMEHQSRAHTALELAQQVGLNTRKQVNPDLYHMEKEGLVAMDRSRGAPMWSLIKVTQRPQPSFPVSAVRVQSTKVESTPSSIAEGMQTEELEEDYMDTTDHTSEDESPSEPAIDLSHIPEENVRERLLAVLEATPPSGGGGRERTDLDLAKCIGGKCTRSQVRPFLEELAKEGRVRKTQGFPVKWSLMTAPPTATSPNSTPQQVSMGSGIQNTGIGLFSVTTDVTDMNRNPVSALSEFCQANKMELNFAEVREFGPPHRKHFEIAAQFGSESYEAESTSKKEAKRMAADLALQSIKRRQVDMYPAAIPTVTTVPSVVSATAQSPCGIQASLFADNIAKISHDFYNQLQSTVDAPQPGRKVIAAFVMEDTLTESLSVVAMGSGTRCITGDHMSLEGLVVNDSHAEVVARRSLVRFFYSQLMEFHQHTPDGSERGVGSTIFVKSDHLPNAARVKEGLKFHLYISTAPCGDGAQFSRGDDLNKDPPPSGDTTHRPTMNTKVQGVLRTKMEGGEGTIPIGDDTRPQTWDGIMQGGRLRTMSCSDKVGRWNVLGLQGALLTHFMEPVYMSSLTLGSLHHHGHLARAVCCRFRELASQNILPDGFHVNHPHLGRVQGGDEMKRHTEKTSQFSLNWSRGDERGELNDGGVGRPVPPPSLPKSQQALSCSRITKACIFSLFLKLAEATARGDLVALKSYKEAKESAIEFQQAKHVLYKFCESKGYGVWMKKPVEQEQFDASILGRLNNQ